MLLRVNFFHCFRGRVAYYPQPPIPETFLEQLNFLPSIQKEKQDFEAELLAQLKIATPFQAEEMLLLSSDDLTRLMLPRLQSGETIAR